MPAPSDTYGALIFGTSGLVGYWRLGESSAGGTGGAIDETGVNHGTYSGTVVFGVTGIPGAGGNTAVELNSADFDVVSVPDNASLDCADTVTVEAWVTRGATQGTVQGIISKATGAYLLRFNASNQLNFLRSQTADIVSSTTTITDQTTWHHVVGTKSGATVKLYIDGVDVTGSVSNSTLADNALALIIGGDTGGGDPLDGVIDEVAVYNVALGASTVLAHYNAGLAAPIPPGLGPVVQMSQPMTIPPP